MPFPAPPLRNLVRFGLPSVVLALGLLLTLGAWSGSRDAHQREVHAYFDYRSRDAVARVEARLHQYEQVLLDARGLFQANGYVSRRQFADFVASVEVDKRHPGIQGVGFALVVPSNELNRHQEQVRRDGFPEYRLRPEGQRALYTSIIYLEPFAERNLRAFGYDMFSEPVRQAAMRRAMESGNPALSGKVQLVQETEQAVQAGFLLYVPVYQNAPATPSAEDLRRHLIGWVYAPFRMNDFMHGVLGEGATDLDLEVYDGSKVRAEAQMFDLHPVRATGTSMLPHALQTLSFAGHSWTMATRALPGLIARHGEDTSLRVLGLGSLVSLLFGLTAFLVMRHLEKVQGLNLTLEGKVLERTQALAETEQRFRFMADHAPVLIWLSGQDQLCTYFNQVWLEFTGRSLAQELGVGWAEGVHPDDLQRCLAVYVSHFERRLAFKMDYRLRHADGSYRWVVDNGLPRFDAQGTFQGYIGTCVDITLRREAEERLRVSEQQLVMAQLIGQSGSWIYEVATGAIWGSAEGLRIFGFPPVAGAFPLADIEACIPERERVHQALEALLSEGRDYNLEFSLNPADGSPPRIIRSVAQLEKDAQGHPLRVLGFLQDITERKQLEATKADLEARNRQFEKAESLGLMAASIAHHFNNNLQAVMASLEVLSNLPREGNPTPFLAMAKLASEKAAAVSRQMLVYLGTSPGAQEPLFLCDLSMASLSRLQQDLPSGVELTTACPLPGPVIKANAGELREILANLVSNAWEALGTGGGSIHLGIGACSGSDLPTQHRFPVEWQPQGSEYACLEVSDTGVGIPSENIEKLFDPFFSTKLTGRGLGLSVVLGLVQAHGGALTVTSQPGQGSVFRVYLPIADAQPGPPACSPLSPGQLRGGSLLLVDDDDLLLQATGALVELLGFSLLTAQDGVAALEVFRQHQSEIRCVVTDLTMPRLDGWGLLEALRQLDPELPVVLASGYDQAQVLAGTHPEQPQAVLGKPFSLKQLRSALGQALAP